MPETVHLLALASSLCAAGATVLIRQGLRGSDTYTGFWINLVVGTVGLWCAVGLMAPAGPVSTMGVVIFVVSGLIGTVAGRLLRFVSIERVGASVSAAVMSLHPFVATALAIMLLGERVTPPIIAGTAVIVLGTLLLSASGRHVGFRARDLTLPFLSAMCFGIVAVLRKMGLGQMGPVLGFAINVTTALVAFTMFLLLSGNRQAMLSWGRSLGYFIAAGLAENAAVFLGLVALNRGTVSVVAPLSSTAPIFVLVLTFFFLRGVEVLSARVVLGTLLIVFGVYLITALS
jgi:DME family drug/metabolite transporter